MKTKINTITNAAFKSIEAANAYFKPYGFSEVDVAIKIENKEISIGKPKAKFGFKVRLGRDGRYNVFSQFTYIGLTKDGVPCYWGKKDSSDPTSRDMTLWIILGEPQASGDNYHRVPVDDEIMLSTTFEYNMKKWNTWIASKIAAFNANRIKMW